MTFPNQQKPERSEQLLPQISERLFIFTGWILSRRSCPFLGLSSTSHSQGEA